jgi:hypothetical protein
MRSKRNMSKTKEQKLWAKLGAEPQVGDKVLILAARDYPKVFWDQLVGRRGIVLEQCGKYYYVKLMRRPLTLRLRKEEMVIVS